MITTVQCAKIMTMLHTCVGPIDKPQTTRVNRAREIHRYAYTVEASNTAASNCHRRPWDNREQPHGTPKFLRKNQQANPQEFKKCHG